MVQLKVDLNEPDELQVFDFNSSMVQLKDGAPGEEATKT